MSRYYLNKGKYPYRIGLRTPIGPIDLYLFSHHDLITVHEVFFREDYRVPENVERVVDIGSNIGVSAAYFLTRNAKVKVHAYEPVPANVARARRNLAAFADRVELVECALGTENAPVSFGIEGSGRYGGITRPYKHRIDVPCRRVGDELRRIVDHHNRIDVLKIDVEGMEVPILKSLPPTELSAVAHIMAECDGREVRLPNFTYDQYLSIARFTSAA
jgi:FkbM family methyltransferase